MKKWLLLLCLLLAVPAPSFATVAASSSRIAYDCNGSTTAFAFTFNAGSESEVRVIKATAAGVETELAAGTGYTVSCTNDDCTSGGTVTVTSTCASGSTLTIIRDVDVTQESDFTEGMPSLYETLENELDKQIRIDQQLQEQLGRSVKLPVSNTPGELNLPPPGAGELIGWNTAGDELTTYSQTRIVQTLDAITVESIAELRLLTGIAGAAVQPLGYYGADDGAGGPLRAWLTGAPGTYTDNGGSIIVPTGGDGSGAWVGSTLWMWSVDEFGGLGSDLLDDTSAIDSAIASGLSIGFPGDLYLTTGGHNIPYPSNQKFYGPVWGSTTIKKTSGTADIFNIEQYAQCSFENMTVDGNNLGGRAFMWRGHYSTMDNVFIKNVGGTSYAVHVSGSNLCNYNNVNMFNCNGGWLIDQGTDPLLVNPTYGALHSTWDHCSVDIATGSAYNALSITGNINGRLTFNSFYFEISGAGSTGLGISVGGSNTYSIAFNELSFEAVNTGAHVIEVDGGVVYGISFDKCSFGVSAARSNPLVVIDSVSGVRFTNSYITDLFTVSPTTFYITNSENVVFEDNTLSYLNNFTFINDAGGNSGIVYSNNDTRAYTGGPGVLSNIFSSDYSGTMLKKSTGGMAGTTTAAAASAGEIGEYIESVVGPVNAPATTVIGDLTSITLTPGDWDISAMAMNATATATITGSSIVGVGTVAGNNLTGTVAGSTYSEIPGPTAASNTALTIPPVRKAISTNTVYYLKMYSTYSAGQPTWYGRISARRVR